MKILNFVFICLIGILIYSCSSDDNSTSTIDTKTAVQILTNGDTKSWKINKAFLNNIPTGNTLEITTSPNIQDDRFIFSVETIDNPNLQNENGSVIWKSRNAINWDAQNIDSVNSDIYNEEVKYGIEISQNSFIGLDGSFDIKIVNEDLIQGNMAVVDGIESQFDLIPVTSQNTITIPTTAAVTQIGEFDLGEMSGVEIGFVGSLVTNSLYIANTQEIDCSGDNYREEMIVRFDLSTQSFNTVNFCQPSFYVTKELELIDEKLVSISGQSVNIYNPSLSSDPEIIAYGTYEFTRFGSATIGNEIYIAGGAVDDDPNNFDLADNLYRLNVDSGLIEVVSTLPSAKFYADIQIVDNKLYLFGGTPEFPPDNELAEDDIYIYDLQSSTWEILQLPYPIFDTSVARYQNLIYVGGYTWLDLDGDGFSETLNNYLGVFNTSDNSYQEIDLGSSLEGEKILRITIHNDILYLVSGIFSPDTIKIFEIEIL